jgi:hypothetical protein
MTFIRSENNIRHVREVLQKNNVATLIRMMNIIRRYDSL